MTIRPNTTISIVIKVPESLADPGHETGLTSEGHDLLSDALRGVAETVLLVEAGDLSAQPHQPAQPLTASGASSSSGSARATDVEQSHATVRSIAADKPLADMIVETARNCPSPWDDRDMTDMLAAKGVTHDRNVVARARGLLEQSGAIRRLGTRTRADRRQPTLHFAHWEQHWLWGLMPPGQWKDPS